MKSKSALITIIVLATLVVGTVLFAQPPWDRPTLSTSDVSYLEQYRSMSGTERISKAWLDIKGRNSYLHPNPDVVMPGDEILLPIGFGPYMAKAGGKDHMWRAAEYYVATYVEPYLNGTVPANMAESPQKPDSVKVEVPVIVPTYMNWWERNWLLLLIMLLVASIVWLANRKKQAKPPEEVPSTNFVDDPPDFYQTSDPGVTSLAQSSLQRALGRGITVIGTPERGFITGEQDIFYIDGECKTEHFDNEPGFRARIKFPDGQERLVVCRWACFNPCWSSASAVFRGTFRVMNSDVAETIPTISQDGMVAVTESIAGGENDLTADALPESPKQAEPSATSDPTQPKKLRVTKLMASQDKGLTLEGDCEVTIDEVYNLLYQVTGRHPDELKKKESASPADDSPAK